MVTQLDGLVLIVLTLVGLAVAARAGSSPVFAGDRSAATTIGGFAGLASAGLGLIGWFLGTGRSAEVIKALSFLPRLQY
ncbi:MAG: hypothetical protein HYY50_02080 [Candidatus Kerfeldbacteria bacterium]|nr:hypothetical protein [Candidatus Kerfeldbacteria bacterium]